MVFNIFYGPSMFVCVCRAVTDSQVREAIGGGATTLDAVTRACGAGGDCGACHNMIEDMVEECGTGPTVIPASQLCRHRAA
jgi:bacterioferritin-associated ferredoxin